MTPRTRLTLARSADKRYSLAGKGRHDNQHAEATERADGIERFADRLGIRGEWTSVDSRPEPEPDLLCIHAARGSIAFELVSLTDPNIAEVQAAGSKARQDAFYTGLLRQKKNRSKLTKKYKTVAGHIELLVYTDSRIITPDDVIIPTILPLFAEAPHPFKCVWFMGEHETRCLWSAS